jgi:hypothetical protein
MHGISGLSSLATVAGYMSHQLAKLHRGTGAPARHAVAFPTTDGAELTDRCARTLAHTIRHELPH